MHGGHNPECGAEWFDDDCYDVGAVGQLSTPPGSNQNSPQKKKGGSGGGNKKVNSTSQKRGFKEEDDDDNDDVKVLLGSSSKSLSEGKSQSGQRKRANRAAFRPPSPELSPTPSPASAASSSARHLHAEENRLRTELQQAQARQDKLERQLDEYRDENSQLLQRLYPEVFACVTPPFLRSN